MIDGSDGGRPLPWQVGDLLTLWFFSAAGALLLFMAWWGASGTPRQSREILWLDVGVIGLLIFGTGAVIWLLTGRRAVGHRRRALLADADMRIRGAVIPTSNAATAASVYAPVAT